MNKLTRLFGSPLPCECFCPGAYCSSGCLCARKLTPSIFFSRLNSYFKNRLRRTWDPETSQQQPKNGPPRIPDADRAPIKSLLIPTLVSTSGQLQTHVADALNTVARNDFPDNWPDLMDRVGALVNSNTPQEVYGGIRALLEVVRVYR